MLQKKNFQPVRTDTILKAPRCDCSFNVVFFLRTKILLWTRMEGGLNPKSLRGGCCLAKVHRNIMPNWGDAWDAGGNGFRVLSCDDGSLLTAEWAFSVALLDQSRSQMCSVCWCWVAVYQLQCLQVLPPSLWSPEVGFMQELSSLGTTGAFIMLCGRRPQAQRNEMGWFFSQCMFPAL